MGTIIAKIKSPVGNAVKNVGGDLTNNVNIYQSASSAPIKTETFKFKVFRPEHPFIGRSKELDDLKNFLQSPGPHTVLVNGLGGIGKTQLVRQFIEKNQKSYNDMICINSESSESIHNALKILSTDRLAITIKNADNTEMGIESIFEQVLDKLSNRKTLLVYDDVSDIDNIKLLVNMVVGEDTHVIITSRMHCEAYQSIQLMEWDLKEATTFVNTTLNKENHKDSILDKQMLVDELQAFPLALKQAIAYINARRKDGPFPISDYLNKCDPEEMFSSDIFHNGLFTLYKKTTFTTWDSTIDAVGNEISGGRLAIEIFNVIAYLDANNINRNYFIRLPSVEELNELEHIKETWVYHAVKLLLDCSMVNRQEYELSIFKLVQQVRKLKLQKIDQEKSTLRVASILISKLLEAEILDRSHSHTKSVFKSSYKFRDLMNEFNFHECYQE